MVVDLDKVAKGIYSVNDKILKKLEDLFGEDILDSSKKLKFNILARKVFSNQEELKKLNRLMFPLIKEDVENIINNNSDKNYVVVDGAVLFDCRLSALCDYIILVKAERDRRESFLKNKNKNLSDEDIELRMNGQYIKVNKNLVNFVIENNNSKLQMYEEVKKILRKIEEQESLNLN